MATSLPILTFHSLDDRRSALSFPPHAFRRGLARLRARGHRTVGLVEAVDCLRRGTPFPERSFAITFDDGYESVYLEAFPALTELGMSATVFVTVGAKGPAQRERLPVLEDRPMLTWRQIREMRECGIDIGAHTLTHPDLTRLPLDRIESEIRDSKEIIEHRLGAPVRSFAYPFGRHDPRSRLVARHHFACACTARLALARTASDPYALERVDAYYLRASRAFDLMSTGLLPAYVWSRSVPRRVRCLLTGSGGHG